MSHDAGPVDDATASRRSTMTRVAVVGTTGSGKTTYALSLAACLGTRHIELDALLWGPHWTEADPEVRRARVDTATAGPAWVADGNDTSLVWERADTVVWLDFPLPLVLWRLIRRIVRRIRTGEELWPGTGNRETVRNAFFRREPLLLYAIRTHRRRRRLFVEALARPASAHLVVHRFGSPREAERWLASVERS